MLGSGSAASVTLCALGNGTDAPMVAVKRLHADARRSRELRTSLAVEAAALRSLLGTPGVVGFLGVALEEHVPREVMDGSEVQTSLVLVMEAWGGGGTLRSQILNCMSGRTRYCGADAARWAVQSARAIADMHARSIAHRDIKPANIVLGVPPGADGKTKNLRCKLTDLGLARCLPRAGATVAPGTAGQHADQTWSANADLPVMDGTHPYISREAAAGGSYDAAAADVFALGVTLYELFAMDLLGAARVDVADPDFLEKWLRADNPWRPRIPREVPAPVASVIRKCWLPSPSERPSAEEVARALQAFSSSVDAGEVEFIGYLAQQQPSWLVTAASAAFATLTSSSTWSYLLSVCGLSYCLPGGAGSSIRGSIGADGSMRSTYSALEEEEEGLRFEDIGDVEFAGRGSESEDELAPLSPARLEGGMPRGF